MAEKDSPYYLAIAQNLSRGFFSYDGVNPEAIWTPGYPAILVALHHLAGLPLWAIVALQLGCLATAIILAAKSLDERARTIFLALCAVYPMPALYVSAIMSEGWALLAIAILAFSLLRPLTTYSLLLLGLVSGTAILIRPSLILLPFVIAAFLLFKGQRMRAAVPVLVAALVLLPYVAWNAATFGKASPLPVASASGTSLYLATWQEILPLEDLNALYQSEITPKAEKAGLRTAVVRVNREIGAAPLHVTWNPMMYPAELQVRANEVLRRAALERIAADPFPYAKHVIKGSWALWNTGAYPAAVPGIVASALALVSGLVFIFGIAGCIIYWRHPAAWLIAYFPAVHIWLHTEARYTAPARVLLLLMAALAVERCWRAISLRVGNRAVPSIGE